MSECARERMRVYMRECERGERTIVGGNKAMLERECRGRVHLLFPYLTLRQSLIGWRENKRKEMKTGVINTANET